MNLAAADQDENPIDDDDDVETIELDPTATELSEEID
jgi:hypothetical protein